MGEKHPLYWLDEDGVPHEVDSDAQGLIDKAEARAQAAEARVEERIKIANGYAEALDMIDRRLTTVEGDNVPRGEAPKLAAREIARQALHMTEPVSEPPSTDAASQGYARAEQRNPE